MRRALLPFLLVAALMLLALQTAAQAPTPFPPKGAQDAEQTVEPVARPEVSPAAAVPAVALSALDGDLAEGFDDITTLVGDGWAMTNNSDPLGTSNWFQGRGISLGHDFSSHSGPVDSYISADHMNTSDLGTISNWLITPELVLRSGDTLSFWTRTSDPSGWPDRLQVRLSLAGDSVDVGETATSVGDFTTLLLEINPDLAQYTYPVVWTRYDVTLTDVPHGATGRIAFRYYVTDGGHTGVNSLAMAIDTFEYAPEWLVHIPVVVRAAP